jgi:hypothetical protein
MLLIANPFFQTSEGLLQGTTSFAVTCPNLLSSNNGRARICAKQSVALQKVNLHQDKAATGRFADA